MNIKLRPCQTDAIKKALTITNALFCIKVGKGKTLASAFLSRILIQNKKIDKTIFCVTSSGVGVFKNEFKNLGVDVRLVTTPEGFIEFLESRDRFVIVKHSFMEEMGKNQSSVDLIEDSLIKNYKKLFLVIDEAHKMSNPDSWASFGVDNTRKFYEKVLLLTATPYSSKLDQVYGLVKLIYPYRWKDLKAFRSKYVESKIKSDWKTGKFIRVEDIAYINLPELRSELEEFTYFYFPPTNLNYYEHKVRLKEENYQEYCNMCRSVYEELKNRDTTLKNKKDKEED